jgi:hypothetical protein
MVTSFNQNLKLDCHCFRVLTNKNEWLSPFSTPSTGSGSRAAGGRAHESREPQGPISRTGEGELMGADKNSI